MIRKTLFALFGILFLVGLMVALMPSAQAEADAQTVKGVIHTLDLKAKTITIQKVDKSTVTLHYNKATLISRNGVAAKIKALALQDAITAKFKAGALATKLTATGAKLGKVAGTLGNAVKGSGLVTIGTKTVQATAQTRISRNGILVSLSQLTRQDTIVSHTKTGAFNAPNSPSEAEDIIAQGPDDGQVNGVINAINGNQVTIAPTNGTPDVTINVTSTTMIEVDGSMATLANLAVGMQVEAHYDPATFDAFSIETDSSGQSNDGHVTGTVAAVDLTAGSVTITPTAGSDVTVTVSAGTEIQVNDNSGTLADITVGMPIRAEFDTATLVAKEINAGSGHDNSEEAHVEGTVAAVDTVALTVTVTPTGGGSDVVLNVTTETDLQVNGVNAAIDVITVGMPIHAEYDPATNNAFRIEAGTDDGGGSGSEESQIDGTVAAVDTTNSTITITPSGGGSDVVLTVTNATEIQVNDNHATLADIHVSDPIYAKYISATMAASELKVGGGGGGH